MKSVCKEQSAGRIICDKKIVKIFDLLISPYGKRSFYIYIRYREHFPGWHFAISEVEKYQVPDLLSKVMQSLPIFLWTTQRNSDALFQIYDGVIVMFVYHWLHLLRRRNPYIDNCHV